MRVKKNLKLITIVPILLLALFSTYFLYNSIKEALALDALKEVTIQSKQLKTSTIQLLRERGLSTLYLHKPQEKIKALLLQQRVFSDQAIAKTFNYFKRQKIEKSLQTDFFTPLKALKNKRQKLDKATLDFDNLYHYVDGISKASISYNMVHFNKQKSAKITKLSSTYIHNLALIRVLSNERDQVTRLLYAKSQNSSREPLAWFSRKTDEIATINKNNSTVFSQLQSSISQEKTKATLKAILAFLLLALALYMLHIYSKFYTYLFSTKHLESLLDKVLAYAFIDNTLDLGRTKDIEKTYKIIEDTVDTLVLEKRESQKDIAAKNIFFANMSHEIRTPINGIMGFTELLKNSDLAPQEKEYVDIIDKSTDNLLEIINNILDLSKLESKKIALDTILFSPLEEFENCIDIYMPRIAQKKINFSLVMDSGFDNFLLGDIAKVKEVLLNLISNALKFTAKNGQISVLIKILSKEEENRQKIYFEVSDSGIGMNKEEMKNIFDAFSQADSTITRKYGGTGLGLTISSNYVAMLGGKLEVSSKKGVGSNFYFTLEFPKEKALTFTQKNRFPTLNALIIKGRNTLLSKTEKAYIDYFGAKANIISIDELKSLKTVTAPVIVAEYQALKKEDYDYLVALKTPTIMIYPSKFHTELSALKTPTLFPSFEPLNITRFANLFIAVSKHYKINIPPQRNENQSQQIFRTNQIKKEILLVEDNLINQKLLFQILKNHGLNVHTATNGVEAVEAVKKQHFDLIFMDIAMPIMDGVRATKEILAFEAEQHQEHTPIVAVTANALKGDKERFLSDGLDDYIAKPIKQKEVQKLLEKYAITLAYPQDPPHKDNQNTNINTDNLKESNKNILLFKKSPVETTIFKKILDKSYQKIEIAHSVEDFFEKLQASHYRVVIVDKEIEGLDLRVMLDLVSSRESTALLLFRSFDSAVDDQIRREFDEVLINSADPTYLKLIVDKYL